jgi:ADP-ribose pyrophosphatase YjhB (NUDIX family)
MRQNPNHTNQITSAAMTAELQHPYLASYCMIRANDTILIQRRFNTGYLDGHWALPSGYVIDGEDALAAASRELLEETSLTVKSDDWRFVCAMHRRTNLGYISVALDCLKGISPRHGSYYSEGWSQGGSAPV